MNEFFWVAGCTPTGHFPLEWTLDKKGSVLQYNPCAVPEIANDCFSQLSRIDFHQDSSWKAACYGPVDIYYGKTVLPCQPQEEAPPALRQLWQIAQLTYKVPFDLALINSYENPEDYIPMHSDDESLYIVLVLHGHL